MSKPISPESKTGLALVQLVETSCRSCKGKDIMKLLRS